MHKDRAVFFRNHLRTARNGAIEDAENFTELLYAFERLGLFLSGDAKDLSVKGIGLGYYRTRILELAERSPLAKSIPETRNEWHLLARDLFEVVKEGRNDALHQGAFARHLTARAIELSIVLEDALMADFEKIGYYMVADPVCGHCWQPISFIRQQMLAHSFSYLPVQVEGAPHWKLVSDLEVAKYLRIATSNKDRNKRLATSLEEAEKDGLTLQEAQRRFSDEPISEVIKGLDSLPILIVRKGDERNLIGILTPFDLL